MSETRFDINDIYIISNELVHKISIMILFLKFLNYQFIKRQLNMLKERTIKQLLTSYHMQIKINLLLKALFHTSYMDRSIIPLHY